MTSKAEGNRAIAYVRVSKERDDMISPDLQLRAIADHCRRHGYDIVDVVEDLDESARTVKRRQIDQTIDRIERGEAAVIVAWRWTRLYRNLEDYAVGVGRVERAGGRAESAAEDFDTTTSVGRFIRNMFAVMAVLESDQISDVWQDIWKRRLAMGLDPRGRQHFGYVKTANGYVWHKRNAAILADLYRRYAAGEAARVLDWTGGNVAILLDGGFGAGLISAGGVMHRGSHRPVITEQEWAAYLARRAETAQPHDVDAESFLLHGLAYCSCGRRLAPANYKGHRTYACYRHRKRRPVTTKRIQENRAEEMIRQWLHRLAHDPATAARARTAADAYYDRLSDQALDAATDIQDNDRASRLAAYRSAAACASHRDPVKLAGDLLRRWPDLTVELRREILRELVDKFTITTGMVARLTGHTAWGTRIRITSDNRILVDPAELQDDDETWLTISEVAARCGVSSSTVCRWNNAGMLPKTKRLSSLCHLYAVSDLDRVMAAPRSAYNPGPSYAAVLAAIEATGTS